MDAIKRQIHHAVASAAQVALGAVMDDLTALYRKEPAYEGSGPEVTAYVHGYSDAIDDVGRKVAAIMNAVAFDYSSEVVSDEV